MKKHLWGCLEKDLSKEAKSGKAHSFQDLVSRTVSAMPKGDCENLSAAAARMDHIPMWDLLLYFFWEGMFVPLIFAAEVCFICALHLCNEKNLELKTDPANPLGDFAIVAHS